MKKRTFVLITAVAMLGFVLVGCGSEKKGVETTASTSVEASAETSASPKRKVKIYTYNDGTYGPYSIPSYDMRRNSKKPTPPMHTQGFTLPR